MTNLLFVCSRNQWRSPAAEKIYRDKGYNARSVGTSPKAKHSISVKDIEWAGRLLNNTYIIELTILKKMASSLNLIFVMEKKHKNRIVAKFNRLVTHKKIHILDIPDDYKYMDPFLVTHLEDVMGVFSD